MTGNAFTFYINVYGWAMAIYGWWIDTALTLSTNSFKAVERA
ncbi:MAG: hypothetical protein AAF892_05845 [Cyanobacteria bacterium P01_D01_bin.71]